MLAYKSWGGAESYTVNRQTVSLAYTFPTEFIVGAHNFIFAPIPQNGGFLAPIFYFWQKISYRLNLGELPPLPRATTPLRQSALKDGKSTREFRQQLHKASANPRAAEMKRSPWNRLVKRMDDARSPVR